MQSGLSVNDFRKLLRKQMAECARKELFDETNEGFGFQAWVRDLLLDSDRGLEEVDVTPFTGDGGIDIFLVDETRKYAVLVSCKFQGEGKPLKRDEIGELFSAHARLMDKAWIRTLREATQDYLGSYADRFKDGYQFKYLFVSAGKQQEEIEALVEATNRDFSDQDLPITAEIWDFHKLKDEWDKKEKLERQTPDELILHFQSDKWMEIQFNRPTILGAIKGNELRNLYRTHKHALFSYNIRTFLGSRGLNDNIVRTAEDSASDFFFFNNGVTAICTEYSVHGNSIKVKGFQIINGAQTVGSLAKAPMNEDLFVQFRLIQSDNVKTEAGINKEIIKWNNTQNPVRLSDFRSNDAIQPWLERQFKEHRWKTKNRAYSPKRGNVARGAIGFEDLCKILCAYKYTPTEVLSSPKALWTMKDEESYGLYEVLFGADGRQIDTWPEERFLELTFAVASMDYLIEKIGDEIKASGNTDRYLKRLRYHALGLLSVCVAREGLTNLTDKKSVDIVEKNWANIKRVMADMYFNHVDEQGMTLFAFVRSTAVWDGMQKRINRY